MILRDRVAPLAGKDHEGLSMTLISRENSFLHTHKFLLLHRLALSGMVAYRPARVGSHLARQSQRPT